MGTPDFIILGGQGGGANGGRHDVISLWKHYEDAIAEFESLRQQGSLYGDLGMGWLHLYKREYELAVVALSRARDRTPKGRAEWNTYVGLAKAHHQLGQKRELARVVSRIL